MLPLGLRLGHIYALLHTLKLACIIYLPLCLNLRPLLCPYCTLMMSLLQQIQKEHPDVKVKYLAEYCFSGTYILTLLTEGYNFTSETYSNINFIRKVSRSESTPFLSHTHAHTSEPWFNSHLTVGPNTTQYGGGVNDILWPKVEGDEFYSSCYMHMQFNSLGDYTRSLKSVTLLIFLFEETEMPSQHCRRKWTIWTFKQKGLSKISSNK